MTHTSYPPIPPSTDSWSAADTVTSAHPEHSDGRASWAGAEQARPLMAMHAPSLTINGVGDFLSPAPAMVPPLTDGDASPHGAPELGSMMAAAPKLSVHTAEEAALVSPLMPSPLTSLDIDLIFDVSFPDLDTYLDQDPDPDPDPIPNPIPNPILNPSPNPNPNLNPSPNPNPNLDPTPAACSLDEHPGTSLRHAPKSTPLPAVVIRRMHSPDAQLNPKARRKSELQSERAKKRPRVGGRFVPASTESRIFQGELESSELTVTRVVAPYVPKPKIKRPRGRPRKYPRQDEPAQSSSGSSSISPSPEGTNV